MPKSVAAFLIALEFGCHHNQTVNPFGLLDVHIGACVFGAYLIIFVTSYRVLWKERSIPAEQGSSSCDEDHLPEDLVPLFPPQNSQQWQ